MSKVSGMLGKLPAKQLPMGTISAYVEGELPKPPNSFDYAHKVTTGFPMAANDKYGDCTIAGVIHMLQLAYAEVGEEFKYPGDDAVVETYLRLTNGADSGLVMVDVLKEWTTKGLFGVKLAAWAPINKDDWEEMRAAAYCFGGLYVGIEVPANAPIQFEHNQDWHLTEDSGEVVGGHCVTISGLSRFGADVETWGDETGMTKGWWGVYGSEVFGIIPEVFVDKNHGPIENINIKALQQDLMNL